MDKLLPVFPELAPAWSANAALPGGNFHSRAVLQEELLNFFPWLPRPLVARWVTHYGSLSYQLLAGAESLGDLGADLGHGLFAREVEYLVNYEWARTVDDILWRRSKLGLLFTAAERQRLENFLKSVI